MGLDVFVSDIPVHASLIFGLSSLTEHEMTLVALHATCTLSPDLTNVGVTRKVTLDGGTAGMHAPTAQTRSGWHGVSTPVQLLCTALPEQV
jgi:hypothetical protein